MHDTPLNKDVSTFGKRHIGVGRGAETSEINARLLDEITTR